MITHSHVRSPGAGSSPSYTSCTRFVELMEANPYQQATNVKAKAAGKAQTRRRAYRVPVVNGLPGVTVTRSWLRAHHEILLELDWVERHAFYANLQRLLPHHCKQLSSWLSPCQLLSGTNTGRKQRNGSVIRLKDARGRPISRQRLITEYFTVARQDTLVPP